MNKRTFTWRGWFGTARRRRQRIDDEDIIGRVRNSYQALSVEVDVEAAWPEVSVVTGWRPIVCSRRSWGVIAAAAFLEALLVAGLVLAWLHHAEVAAWLHRYAAAIPIPIALVGGVAGAIVVAGAILLGQLLKHPRRPGHARRAPRIRR